MSDNKKSSFFGLGVVFGTIIGGLTALFLSPQSGKKNREEVVKKARQLKKLIEQNELETKVKEIFGEVTKEAKEFYLRAKEAVITKLAEVKEKVEEIDKEKYVKLVNEAVKELKKESKYAEKIFEKLEKHLKDDWEKLS